MRTNSGNDCASSVQRRFRREDTYAVGIVVGGVQSQVVGGGGGVLLKLDAVVQRADGGHFAAIVNRRVVEISDHSQTNADLVNADERKRRVRSTGQHQILNLRNVLGKGRESEWG